MKRYYILPNNEPTGATFTPPTLQQLRDIGYLIVTDAPYSADSSGVADATTAIQNIRKAGVVSVRNLHHKFSSALLPLGIVEWRGVYSKYPSA
jgi:hypothetical protein